MHLPRLGDILIFAYVVIIYYSLQFYEISVTIPVSTFTIDFVFEYCFLSAMTPYVDSRDGRSLSLYGSECQIWMVDLYTSENLNA
jgi:hypothetical protein